MKINYSEGFSKSLAFKVYFISQDSPSQARDFKNKLLQKCNDLKNMPYKYRKSIYYDNENIRDMIFKGYTVVYEIDENFITVFALINQEICNQG